MTSFEKDVARYVRGRISENKNVIHPEFVDKVSLVVWEARQKLINWGYDDEIQPLTRILKRRFSQIKRKGA